jgi:hypothetical protein
MEDPSGGRGRRGRILDSAPVQAFWTSRHPPEVDIQEAWNTVVRQGLAVIDAEHAENATIPLAP